MAPWLKTRSMGALEAGTDKTLYVRCRMSCILKLHSLRPKQVSQESMDPKEKVGKAFISRTRVNCT